jgi:hypothetical protein
MEQNSFREATSRSASQKIPCLLRNPKVHYHVRKIPPLTSNLSQINLVHTHKNYLFPIHLNIILLSTSRTPKWSLRFKNTD